jgi:hypothetical protein
VSDNSLERLQTAAASVAACPLKKDEIGVVANRIALTTPESPGQVAREIRSAEKGRMASPALGAGARMLFGLAMGG